MGKPRSHRLDIYGARLHVATTNAQMGRLAKRFDLGDPDSIGATYLSIDTQSNEPHLTVWIDTAKVQGADLVDTIAHEAVHAAAQLLDHIGQRVDRHDSEALAYLTGWIAARCWEATT